MRFSVLIILAGGLFLSACQADIGDSCTNSSDCSVSGDRVCDRTQPGGYCTIQGCDPDTCPGRSLCVEWRFVPGRLSERFCMAPCQGEGSCRDNYDCVNGLGSLQSEEAVLDAIASGAPFARVIDIQDNKAGLSFCAAKTEDCSNGLDDNANGLVDCEDIVCCTDSVCSDDPSCS